MAYEGQLKTEYKDLIVRVASVALPIEAVREKLEKIEELSRELLAGEIDPAAYAVSRNKVDLPGFAWFGTPDILRSVLVGMGFNFALAGKIAASQEPHWRRAIDEGYRAQVGILFAQDKNRVVKVVGAITDVRSRQSIMEIDEEATRIALKAIHDVPNAKENKHLQAVLGKEKPGDKKSSHRSPVGIRS